MKTPWIEEQQLQRALERNEAFWDGALDGPPLLWLAVPNAKTGTPSPEPDCDEALWTDLDYFVAATEDRLARTWYGGDALPVSNPWLGPDQFAAWLGAEMELKPRENTSWVKPFVEDWNNCPEFHIAPDNLWWRLYLDMLRRCVERGKDKWVTPYPDLHTGIDALSAIRGGERLAMDLLTQPEAIHRAMEQMTELFKFIVDVTSEIILPAGQGTSNWTGGWSQRRFICIGQNDFTCMISPGMFDAFCWRDTLETCNHADVSIYHLDGPGCAAHLDKILRIEKLNCIQWVQGAGAPLPSQWLPLLKCIQDAGESVQVLYAGSHGGQADLPQELGILCEALDPRRLFIYAEAPSIEAAEAALQTANRFRT